MEPLYVEYRKYSDKWAILWKVNNMYELEIYNNHVWNQSIIFNKPLLEVKKFLYMME